MHITKLGYIYFHIKHFNTPLDMTLSTNCVDLFSKKSLTASFGVYVTEASE